MPRFRFEVCILSGWSREISALDSSHHESDAKPEGEVPDFLHGQARMTWVASGSISWSAVGDGQVGRRRSGTPCSCGKPG